MLELLKILKDVANDKIQIEYQECRPGDQLIFISDNSKAKDEFSWEPKVGYKDGIEKLNGWVKENLSLFKNL